MTFDPTQNRVPTCLLTADELAALKAAKHGWEYHNGGNDWRIKTGGDDHLYADTVYRAKPAPAPTLSITVNGVTNVVAAGVTDVRNGQKYWVVCLNVPEFCTQNIWDGLTAITKEWLERGLIHTSEAAARAHAMAMVGLKAEGV